MMTLRTLAAILAFAATGHAEAVAQYDRDGRYVPSPMGVPRDLSDRSARPIPMYPGTPGRAVGTPYEPPLAPARPNPPMLPRVETPPLTAPLVPLTRAQCEEGWSAAIKMPRVEFNRRCARMRKP